MAMASVVVTTESGATKAVLASLARMPGTRVYGSKENEIVAVIEARSVADLVEGMQRLAEVNWVVGVYPVYADSDD